MTTGNPDPMWRDSMARFTSITALRLFGGRVARAGVEWDNADHSLLDVDLATNKDSATAPVESLRIGATQVTSTGTPLLDIRFTVKLSGK